MKNFIKVLVWTAISLCIFSISFSQSDSLIIFLNDGSQKSVTFDKFEKADFIPVELVVQEIILNQGWNLISTNIIPRLPDFLENIWADNADKFVIAKNNSGSVFIPQFGINNIGRWDITQGYQVYSTATDTVYISGEEVNPVEKEIELKSGWNMTAFLCNTLMNAATALDSISDNNNLLIAKNQEGQVYIPSFGINSLGNLIPGQGYRLYVTNDDVLKYPKNPNNLEYVKIGTQFWTKKNLEVSTYRNGDTIRYAASNADWVDAGNKKEGAWCYYNNDSANGAIYGKLYNWYAVNDPRGLAPLGWHVPSDNEWTTLENYLKSNSQYWCNNNSSYIAMALAAKEFWKPYSYTCAIGNNLIANNRSGFTALPGGTRDNTGNYGGISYYGYWWSSTENSDTYAWSRYLVNSNLFVVRGYFAKVHGFSVRCIKD